MNVLQRATLLLYAFDPTPDDTSPIHEVDVALSLLGRWPRMASVAHAAYEADEHNERLVVPPAREDYSMAETILDVLRGDEGFTRDEAMLLDVMLMLHAEHGGGNNSTFTTRVLSSSGTDAYSAYAGALGSLKGPKHGGANYKAGEMIDDIAAHVSDWGSDDAVGAYLEQILLRKAYDRTGLIYGLGHAVYTVTDPRAEIVKHYAADLAEKRGQLDKLELIKRVERLGPKLMREVRGIKKPISTNIDMYTGFVYEMLGIPQDMFTPIFAIARMAGWAAHRMEELYGSARIIRPAYNSYMDDLEYEPLSARN
jgi:citrate synthase